jgi:hypothetical protein
MKRLTVLPAIVFFALAALPALAASVTGTWTAQDKDPDGNLNTITYVLKQEGSQLTGTASMPDETANISSGKVDGDKISFAVAFSFDTITHTGAINGDEITMTVKSEDPEFATHEITLKRSK